MRCERDLRLWKHSVRSNQFLEVFLAHSNNFLFIHFPPPTHNFQIQKENKKFAKFALRTHLMRLKVFFFRVVGPLNLNLFFFDTKEHESKTR